jgi:hypothetical protein
MKEEAVKDAFDGMRIEQLVDYLMKETIEAVQERGVQHMLNRMEDAIAETFKGRTVPRYARGIFLVTIECAIYKLYSIPNHTLTVAHGIDHEDAWITAICSSGAFALWYSDPAKSQFNEWDREAQYAEKRN